MKFSATNFRLNSEKHNLNFELINWQLILIKKCSISLLDAGNFVHTARQKVSQTTIANAFSHVGFVRKDGYEPDKKIQLIPGSKSIQMKVRTIMPNNTLKSN